MAPSILFVVISCCLLASSFQILFILGFCVFVDKDDYTIIFRIINLSLELIKDLTPNMPIVKFYFLCFVAHMIFFYVIPTVFIFAS